MKLIANLSIAAAGASVILGLISRVTLRVFPLGLNANSFLQFANTCLLFTVCAILLGIRDK